MGKYADMFIASELDHSIWLAEQHSAKRCNPLNCPFCEHEKKQIEEYKKNKKRKRGHGK